jgi:uncharacterized membrane protein
VILYNTVVGVASGLALCLVPALGRRIARGTPSSAEGWALAFGVLGLAAGILGGLITVTWPITAKPQANILFGEPTLLLGLLLLAAAAYLWRHPDCLDPADDDGRRRLQAVLGPVSWVVFGLGLILLSCSIAVFQFSAIGAAPPTEPISGSLPAGVENAFFGVLYLVTAAGTLLAPWAVRDLRGAIAQVAGWCLMVAGVVLTLYSAMNYYTHIGDLVK